MVIKIRRVNYGQQCLLDSTKKGEEQDLGFETSIRLKVVVKTRNFLHPIFFASKLFKTQNLFHAYILLTQNFEPKNFGVKISFMTRYFFGSQKNYRSKKNLRQQNFVSNKLLAQNNWGLKNLDK